MHRRRFRRPERRTYWMWTTSNEKRPSIRTRRTWHERSSFDRHVYDFRDDNTINGESTASKLRFILLLREPAERLHDAFWHYDHYQKHFGANEDGFDKFAREMTDHFKLSAANTTRKAAHDIGSRRTIRSSKPCFFADQLIKNMYSVWIERWFEVFDKEQFLFFEERGCLWFTQPNFCDTIRL